MHTRLCTYSQMHSELQTGGKFIVKSSLSSTRQKMHNPKQANTRGIGFLSNSFSRIHTPSTQCKGHSSVLWVPTVTVEVQVVGGRLTHSEAAELVETRLWMWRRRSRSWGPTRLQSFCQSRSCEESVRTLWHCC